MENKKQFTKKDFTHPREFFICPICGEDLSVCDNCEQEFNLGVNNQVSCGRDVPWHICWDCWRDLPEDE